MDIRHAPDLQTPTRKLGGVTIESAGQLEPEGRIDASVDSRRFVSEDSVRLWWSESVSNRWKETPDGFVETTRLQAINGSRVYQARLSQALGRALVQVDLRARILRGHRVGRELGESRRGV